MYFSRSLSSLPSSFGGGGTKAALPGRVPPTQFWLRRISPGCLLAPRPLEERCPMANVVKKHSISSELAQTMLAEAMAKAREIGVGIPTLARVAAWGGGFPIKVDGEIVEAIGLSGAPTVQNDIDRARAAVALVSGAVLVD
jgi:hypothetical protein